MFAEKLRIKELVVSNAFSPLHFDCGYDWHETNCGFKWVHTTRYQNQDSILYNFRWLPRLLDGPLILSALKRLSLQCYVGYVELQFVNTLAHLEHLELYSVYAFKGASLSLDRLKVLRIQFVLPIKEPGCGLQLNTPQLEIVAAKFGFENWKITNPSSVKQIQLSGPPGSLRKYVNVEKVRVDHISLVDAELLSLPNLRELRWIYDSYGLYDYLKTKSKFESLIKLRKSGGRSKAKFFCLGEEFEKIRSFDHFLVGRHRIFFNL